MPPATTTMPLEPAAPQRSASGPDLAHPGVSDDARASAEIVRRHLVHLRGGAPFLSPADTLLLVRWLDAGVETPVILAALERCAESRRRNGARARFTLVSAKRHLNKPPLVPIPEGTMFELLEALQASGDAVALGMTGALGEATEVVEAVGICAELHDQRWESLPSTEREARLERASLELGDLANLLDPTTLAELAEEVARHAHRSELPCTNTPYLQRLLS